MPRVLFKVRGETHFGESLKIIGSDRSLGCWNVDGAIELKTSGSDYPVWTAGPLDVALPLEYKYIKITNEGGVFWEEGDANRRLPDDPRAVEGGKTLEVDDGGFNYIQPEPFAYPEGTNIPSPGSRVPAIPSSPRGLKVVVFGSSVSAGHKAWLFRGWAEMLGEVLHSRYGHGFVNAGIEGINTERGLQLYAEKVAPLQPDVVILAFGLGNEGLPHCPGHERAHVYQGFLGRLSELVTEVHRGGALPVLGGIYPHGSYNAEHNHWVKKAAAEMPHMGVPILSWLDSLTHPDGSGRWCDGISFDPSHPNTEGHRRMFASIDVSIFDPGAVVAQRERRLKDIRSQCDAEPVFKKGPFKVYASVTHDRRCELRVCNESEEPYMLNVDWHELQQSLEHARRARPGILKDGIYIATDSAPKTAPSFIAIDGSGRVESRVEMPPNCNVEYHHASSLFRPSSNSCVLFYDGNLAVIQEPGGFQLLNESNVEYNVHPMWRELRLATRKLPHGLYEDGSGRPFCSAIVSAHGLSSRVKVPPRSGIALRCAKELSAVSRVALLPIGDRCSVRMLLHKIEYDGPCYPFDLARCTSLADAADILRNNFQGLWEPSQLSWDGYQGRLFHQRWHSLSFAHEVEEGDEPDNDMNPVWARMAKRYTGRAARFNYSCKHANRVLFVRTGCASRSEVEDLMAVIAEVFKVRPQLLLISDQPSEQFLGVEGVTHVRESFDPDRMYEDEGYWNHCACRFRHILDGVGINTATLYWCPNDLKEAEKEAKETPPETLVRKTQVKTFSHSNLFEHSALKRQTSAGASPQPPVLGA
eukprot:TRINITY_DN21469_c0_g1_i1.p1 TRINITY_DN21469_c0_g1~~TRINITY_DN21469_c0_g1_i1.p1  ORF type:complete len:812 (-),score=90.21 TRINITY_DN21469_c0_g1_i1:554-2989(-)